MFSIICLLFASSPLPASPIKHTDLLNNSNFASYVNNLCWDSTRANKFKELSLSLPKLKYPYSWSVETDDGKFPGLKIQWKTIYFGSGGQAMVLQLSAIKKTGFYVDIIDSKSGNIVLSNTYVFYPQSGVNFIPPDNVVRGAVDEQGNLVGLYDLQGHQVVSDSVYGNIEFPNRYVMFSDVKSTHWAFKTIYQVVGEGYFQGFSDGTFRPDKNMTRAEFAAVLSTFLKSKYPEEEKRKNILIKDIKPADWFYKPVRTLADYINITDFQSLFKNQFLPNRNITRNEAANILYAVLKSYPKYEDYFPRNIYFSDVKTNAKGIEFCIDNNIMKGFPNNTFKPDKNLTRAEATSLLILLDQNL